MTSLRQPNQWMLTYTGRAWWPLDPDPNDVDIVDIAHALSMLCRFSGMVREFYSVAEHSWHVSTMVPRAYALEALLHDASEAYCCDVVRPLKYALPDYLRVEALNQLAVRTKFGLPHIESPCVKEADNNILSTERRDLLPAVVHGQDWIMPGVLDERVMLACWSPGLAERMFLERFEELGGLR